ncbi:MAG: FHA domain-containing protein [Chloroflexi bacterium]|nr:FHA domain-containing protein [Chloroflexota bacterium]
MSNIEVVQVVQDPGNTVPLVARKGTVARVFVKLGNEAQKPLEGVSARLRGYRDGSGGTIGSVYRISSSIPAEPSRRNGNHCVRVSGGAQTDYCFDLTFQGHTTGAPIDEDAFTVRVPVSPGTTKIALRRGNRELASRTATRNAPAVTVASPKPGDSWRGNRTVEWTATDADNDTLSYAVQYSPDGGQSWYPLAVDASDPRYTVDSKALAPGNQVYVRVLASDGLNTVVDQSGPFTIEDQRASGSSSTLLYLLLGAGAAGAAAGGGALAAAGRRRNARRRAVSHADPAWYPDLPAFPAAAPVATPASAPARLLVIQGQTNARWLDLTMPVAQLGRGSGSTLQLQDAAASHHHARLTWTEQGWLLEDLQSRNGTYVNGERITWRLLYPGDHIQICSIVMQFQSPE